MKKEGTGKPRHPDISLDADVKMGELHFKEVPETEVYFQGNSRRNSVWESRREGLPDEVQESVFYRNARVRLRIASEKVDRGPNFRNSFGKERVKTSFRGPGTKIGEQETEGREEK